MSARYQSSVMKLTETDLQDIASYYQDWVCDDRVDFKFRYLKAYVINRITKRGKWIFLHRQLNKRRFNSNTLNIHIRELIDQNLIPIRLFFSICEWLAPHEIDRMGLIPRILKSNYYVFENDESLDKSLASARKIQLRLDGPKINIYSGNKSVHTWWKNFNLRNYIDISESIEADSKAYEKANRMARKILFEQIQKDTSIIFDERSSVDTRRILPIIGSLNGFTKRRVIEIQQEELQKIETAEIITKSKI